MKNTDFEKALKHALSEDAGAAQWKTTAFLAGQEAMKKPARISFWQLLVRQIRYIGWKLWGVQAVVLLTALWMLGELYGEPFWEGSVIRLLFCLSALTAMMALPILYRSVRYRMQEIEAAAYFSSVKLLMAKLLVLAVGDLALLLGIFIAAMALTPLQAGRITLSLCLPFLVTSGGGLYMLGHWKAERFLAGSGALGTGILLLAAVLPGKYLPAVSLGWLAVCGGLLVFCIMEVRYLTVRSSYMELQI